MQATLTIITATYNIISAKRKETFLQMLDSVQKQNYPHIQHLVIDGNSNDGTIELLESHKLDYISEPDKGIYDAMNKGIKLAKGKYILFLNSDDYLIRDDAISLCLEALEKDKADFLAGNVRVIFEETPIKNYIAYANFKKLFEHIPFCHQALICKTEIMQKFLFDIKYKIAADYDFIFKLFINNYKGIAYPLTIAAFRADGASHNNRVAKENKEIQEKNKQYKEKILLALQEKNQQNFPLLSVISPSCIKNSQESIQSLQKQSYEYIEHIIAHSSLKDAIEKAQGDYIYILSPQSTFVNRTILEEIMAQLKKENVHAIYSDLELLLSAEIEKKVWKHLWQREDFLKNNLPYQAFIYKKECFEYTDLFNENELDDFAFHTKLFIEKGFAYAYSKKTIAKVNKTENRSSSNVSTYYKDFLNKKSPYDGYFTKKRVMLFKKITLVKIEESMWHKKYKILGFLPVTVKK